MMRNSNNTDDDTINGISAKPSEPTPIDDLPFVSDSDRLSLSGFIREAIRIKKEMRLISEDLKPLDRDNKFVSAQIKSILMPYQTKGVLPKDISIDSTPVSYVEGSWYIDEKSLLLAGVSKNTIDACRRQKPGYFVVDRKSPRSSDGEEG